MDAQAPPGLNNVLRLDNSVYRVVQTINIGNILATNNSVSQFYSTAFTLGAHVTQSAQFATIFDQYRIDLIEAWVQPSFNNPTTAFGINSSCMFYSVTDYDNAASLGTIAAAMQYTNVLMTPYRTGHYRKWKPHVAQAAYGSAAFGSFMNKPSDWIDSISTTVEHYGLKLAVEPLPTSQACSFTLIARLHLSFRNII